MASKWLKAASFRRTGGTILAAATISGMAVAFGSTPASATDLTLHAPHQPWYHKTLWHSFDHASLRRGFQVYREVCSACHSMKYVCYRHLVGVCLTEEEAKAHAEEITVKDGPNDAGLMFDRPGRLSDTLPNPYPNEVSARLANNGALPPDFSYLVLARHGQEDYIFQILTGYCDPPAGRTVNEGQYYNPYFPGGAIGMARALYNEMIEYEDGTPATASQMAKDVVTFLAWAADPHNDTRKRWLIKFVILGAAGIFISYYLKRVKWSYLKTMKFAYKNRKPPKDI